MSNLPGIGFARRAAEDPAPKLRPVALLQLIALALALSTLIAATAVSIGFARAHVTPAAASRQTVASVAAIARLPA